MKTYYTYILASKRNGTLYVGVTNDIERRVDEHKQKVNPNSFTSKYNVSLLVYFEEFGDVIEAIRREKYIKKCSRLWKLKTIESKNPNWDDLSKNF